MLSKVITTPSTHHEHVRNESRERTIIVAPIELLHHLGRMHFIPEPDILHLRHLGFESYDGVAPCFLFFWSASGGELD
jgi:hypothetical protein